MRTKGLVLMLLMLGALLLSACGGNATRPEASMPQTTEAAPVQAESTQADAEEETAMKLLIEDTEVPVQWEDNESVAALRELLADGPLTISMSMYGGFEQVGFLGTSLPRNDAQTVTEAGDIVLYAGNQIVVFYASNSWAYTRLGRIIALTPQELTELLSNGDISLTIIDE